MPWPWKMPPGDSGMSRKVPAPQMFDRRWADGGSVALYPAMIDAANGL